MKHFVHYGIVNNTNYRNFIDHQSYTTGNIRKFTNKIGCSINWVNNPGRLISQNNSFPSGSTFLSDYIVLGIFYFYCCNNGLKWIKSKIIQHSLAEEMATLFRPQKSATPTKTRHLNKKLVLEFFMPIRSLISLACEKKRGARLYRITSSK